MGYIPKPLDTSDVVLSDDIMELAEALSRNTHEIWSMGRINEGWVYGDKLDMSAKTHHCLIPYEELPESEKDFDRRTSQEAIKFLIKSGYKIVKE